MQVPGGGVDAAEALDGSPHAETDETAEKGEGSPTAGQRAAESGESESSEEKAGPDFGAGTVEEV